MVRYYEAQPRSPAQLLFLSEVLINSQLMSHQEGKNTNNHHNNKEPFIPYCLCQGTREQAWNHHLQRHKTRTESIMTGLVFALTEINHKEHIGTKAKTITEILNKNRYTDCDYIIRKHISQIDVG